MRIPFRTLSPLALALLIAGCDKPQIQTYRVSKDLPQRQSESASAEATPADSGGTSAAGGIPEHSGMQPGDMSSQAVGDVASGDAATYETPAGWELQPRAAMREASFIVKGEGDASADVSLIILGGGAGNTLDNVNRWLSQLGKPPVTSAELDKLALKLESGVGEVVIVDLQGDVQGADATKDGRILAGIGHRGSDVWFFKMRGNPAVVGREVEHFKAWVKSTKPKEAGSNVAQAGTAPEVANVPPMAAARDTAPADSPAKAGIQWSVPSGWSAAPASGMRYATFNIEGDGGKSEVTVVNLGGEAGSDLANVNRWRQQLGLAPVAEGDLPSAITRIGSGIAVVDLTSPEKRMIAGWTRHDDVTWFFKLVGPAALVEKQKEAFIGFLNSVKF